MENMGEAIATLLIDTIFGDQDKLRKAALASMKPLTVKDVAYLLEKDPSTITRWQKSGKIRMNVGPDGHLTMSVDDFDEWYRSNYRKPAPRL